MHQHIQAESRSTRCIQCRQRKVKCDGVQPTCRACTRLSLPCSWTPMWRFREQRRFVERRYKVSGAIPSRRTWDRIEFVDDADILLPLGVSSADDNTTSNSASPERNVELQLPVPVDPLPSMRLQMLAVAMHHYLPRDQQSRQCQSIETWLNLSPRTVSLVAAVPLLNAAVDAFILAQTAIALADSRFAHASIRQYNTCLNVLRAVLKARSSHARCDILLSMFLLMTVECMHPIAQPGGFFLHIQGMVQFFLNQAPQPLRSCYETKLFQCARQASILWSIARGQRTPFDTEEWILLSKSAPLVTSETRLLDIGVKIPNLLAADHDGDMGDSLRLSRLSEAVRSLSLWIEAYSNEKGVILLQTFDPVQFPDFARLVTHDFPGCQVLFCASFSDAFYLSLAWTLLFIVQLARFHIVVNSFEAPATACKQLNRSLRLIASALCSTIPQFFDSDWGFVARHSINLFLQLLIRYYESIGRDGMVEFLLDVKRALVRPELGHTIVTEPELAVERYFPSLNIIEIDIDAS